MTPLSPLTWKPPSCREVRATIELGGRIRADSVLPDTGALRSERTGVDPAGSGNSGVRSRRDRNRVLLLRGSRRPVERRGEEDPLLAPGRDLRAGKVRRAFVSLRRRNRSRSGTPVELQDGLVHQCRRHLPFLRIGGDHPDRTVAAIPSERSEPALRSPAEPFPGVNPRPDDRVPLFRASHLFRRRRPPRAQLPDPRSPGGESRIGTPEPGGRPRLRRLGPGLLHRSLRSTDGPEPHQRGVLRHRPVQQRALASLVLQGPDVDRRTGAAGVAAGNDPGADAGQSPQQRHRVSGQLQRDSRIPRRDAAPLGAGKSRAHGGFPGGPRHHLHRGNPQLPVGRGSLSRSGDGDRRAHPGRPRHREGIPGGGRDGRLLRGESAYSGLRAALGGRRVPVSGQPGLSAGDRDRGQRRRLRLRQQVRGTADPGIHPLLRPAAPGWGTARVDQAHHVHRGHRPDRRAPPAQGGTRSGDVGGQDRRPRLSHRSGRGGRLQHGSGRERGRAGFQRRPAGRRGDGAEGQPGDPRLRGNGGRESHRQHPRPGRRRKLQRAQGDRRTGRGQDRASKDPRRR